MESPGFHIPKLPVPQTKPSLPVTRPICTQTAPRPTKRRAPRKFVRLRPTKSGNLLQTAITTYQSPEKTLHIHSLLHLAEPDYYESLDSPADIVLFELLTHSGNTTAPPRRLKTSIVATPSAQAAARSLSVAAQADVLDLRKPGWYVADVPSEQLPPSPDRVSIPDKPLLRLISALLPCPELNLLALDLRGVSPIQILQLLKAPFPDKRKFLYAWRCDKTTTMAANSSTDELTKLRDEEAWKCVNDAKGLVALLYGAWHTGRFCRLAEASGMSFVKQKWVTAMTVPSVEVFWWDWVVWGVIGGSYCALTGWDWVAGIEDGFTGDWVDCFLYVVRHCFVYIAARRWFSEME